MATPRGAEGEGAEATRRRLAWVAILYFVQGFPFGLLVDNLPVYFRSNGVSLEQLGLLSLLGLPWTLKVLWAPLVDRYLSARLWIAGALALMAAGMAVLPWAPPTAIGGWLAAVVLGLTFASATQDIAIDGHTIRMLAVGEEGRANGIRLVAYRAAVIVSGGALVALAQWVSWAVVFQLAAAALLLLAGVVWAALPPAAVAHAPVAESWWQPLREWVARPGAWLLFGFILTFKLGDSSMGPMVKPFWVDRGFGPAEIGMVSTTFGIAASVVGALAGGALTSRWGLTKALLGLGFLQAFSNLGYAVAAYADAGRAGVYAASLCESFTGGMGTAAFLAFLMRCCDRERAATEYALLSAIFALSRQLVGPISGVGAAHFGYATYFALTFLLALPALALVPWLRPWIEAKERADLT